MIYVYVKFAPFDEEYKLPYGGNQACGLSIKAITQLILC